MVSDLDSKVFPYMKAKFPYVQKEHCKNHLAKSMRKHFTEAFSTMRVTKMKDDIRDQVDSGNIDEDDLDKTADFVNIKVWTDEKAALLSNRYTNLIMHNLQVLHKRGAKYKEIHDVVMAIPYHYADGVDKTIADRQLLHANCSSEFCKFKSFRSLSEQNKYVPNDSNG